MILVENIVFLFRHRVLVSEKWLYLKPVMNLSEMSLDLKKYHVPGFRVREARKKDLMGMAAVTGASWRRAFSSFLSDEVLSGGSSEFFHQLWFEILSASSTEGALVVESGDKIVGCGAVGSYRAGYNPPLLFKVGPGVGELYRGYIDPAYQGFGLGKLLLLSRLNILIERGYAGVCAWIYAANAPARGFYEHMGAKFVGQGEGVTMSIHHFREVCYFLDLSRFGRTSGRGGELSAVDTVASAHC